MNQTPTPQTRPTERESATLTLEGVYTRVAPLVHRRSLALLGCEEEALDATQEVLLKLHRHLRTLRSSDALVAWVWRTTTNHCLNCIRKRRRERLEFVQDVDTGPASRASGGARDPRGEIERHDVLRRTLQHLVARLGQRKVSILVLYHYDGMTQAEIGLVLGISERAVRKALAKLRDRMVEETRVLRAEMGRTS